MNPEAILKQVREVIGDHPPGDPRELRNRILQHPVRSPNQARSWRARQLSWTLATVAMLGVIGITIALTGRESPGEGPVARAGSASAQRSPEAGSWLRAPKDAPLELPRLFGGSIRLEPGSLARVNQLSSQGAYLVLETGRAAFEVDPAARVPWVVDVGPYQVRVVGTRFDLDWKPRAQELAVHVERGKVRVHGPGAQSKGLLVEEGHFLRLDARAHSAQPSPVEPESDVDNRERPAEPRPEPGDHRAGAAQDWKMLARGGKHRQALELAVARGFDGMLQTLGRMDLQLLADAARLAPDAPRARQALLALRNRFGGSEPARRAAFHLARLAADAEGSPGQADRWLSTYLEESPGGPFAREALGRLIAVNRQLGRSDQARAHASAYLKRYPNGPHADLARSLLH